MSLHYLLFVLLLLRFIFLAFLLIVQQWWRRPTMGEILYIKANVVSVYLFVTYTCPLDLLAARSNNPLICGPKWLCERRICAAPKIWARGQKKQRNISHTRMHVRMHARFPHPMLSLHTHMGTHPQILASERISGHDQDLGISISSSSSLLLLRGFLTRSLRKKLL